MLHLDRLTRRYAGLLAVDAVTLDIPTGGVHALVGPNGAGKTTLFNMVSGLVAPSSGRVLLDGLDLTRLPPERRARAGIGRTFQAIRLFPDLTVRETAMAGVRTRTGPIRAILGFGRNEAKAVRARAEATLDRAGLARDTFDRIATTLSYGDQRRLEIARALVANPRLLLLDEPAAGMNPNETARLGKLVRSIAADGVTVLLVEHDMGFVMGIADTLTVLSFGRLIFHGRPEAGRCEPCVVEAYLGHKLAAQLAQPQLVGD